MKDKIILYVYVLLTALWFTMPGIAKAENQAQTSFITNCSRTYRTNDSTSKIRVYAELEKKLNNYISDKDAMIGIAVIVDGTDTISVNGDKDFPMLSVYKFPQAIAVADYCKIHHISVKDTIAIYSEELLPETWSPMRDRYGQSDLRIPLKEILAYSLQQSDNNACDILFRLIGEPAVVDSVMKESGFRHINIHNTEAEMHKSAELCYANSSTPTEMARLFDWFYRQGKYKEDVMTETIGELMISCNTGTNRLVAPKELTGIKVGHKTGTGVKDSHGRLIAVNDCGYVFQSECKGYSIAVFITDSGYSMPETENLIAELSAIVFNTLHTE